MNTLKEKAVLMRLSIGLPGDQRQDSTLTESVKAEHKLGQKSGRWVKNLYPAEALEPIRKLDGEARTYHNSVTLPFDSGIGILPAALIMEYGDRMRRFRGMREHLVDSHFLDRYDEWKEWAKQAHNGTFDESEYPPLAEMKDKFYFKIEPLPVPDAAHFVGTVASLLGTDVDSVNARVTDAAKGAQQELMKRLIVPVRHMVETLSKDKPRIYDTLISNIMDIARIAPALNLEGDQQIEGFVHELTQLASCTPAVLRDSELLRLQSKQNSEELLKRLEAYKI